MIDNEFIVSRIKKLMHKNKLTPSSFAKKIESKRANVSHILSGRNKTSLNFLIKIVNSFDNISLDWFIAKDISILEDEGENGNSNKNIEVDNTNKVKTIVHFYDNGTFKVFKNSD
tara:strand:+ start:16209 stop:16553 length:345 start_codon:yes stop_codon:yes gene_type:complete